MSDDTKSISLSVSGSDYAAFQQAAQAQGRPVAQLIREAMAVYRAEHLERRRPLRELPRLVGHKPVRPLPSRGETYDEIFDRG
jgi:hypothetical protein